MPIHDVVVVNRVLHAADAVADLSQLGDATAQVQCRDGELFSLGRDGDCVLARAKELKKQAAARAAKRDADGT